MKKNFYNVFYVTYLLWAFLPLKGLAQSGGFTPTELPNPLRTNRTLIEVIDSIVGFLLTASVLIGTVMVVYAGFLIITSAGNTDKVQQGKRIIVYTVVGLGIMLLFRVIIAIIEQILGVRVTR